jgi:hypothetical protein
MMTFFSLFPLSLDNVGLLKKVFAFNYSVS